MTKKEALQKKCNDLEIKFQENDTIEQLELMITGKESAPTIEALQKEVAKLKEAEGADESEKLKKAKEEIRGLKNQVKDAQGMIASQDEVITTMEKQLRNQTLTAGNTGNRVVEIDEVAYVINGPSDPKKATLKFEGRYYTADELAADPDLCKRILKKGTTLIYRA